MHIIADIAVLGGLVMIVRSCLRGVFGYKTVRLADEPTPPPASMREHARAEQVPTTAAPTAGRKERKREVTIEDATRRSRFILGGTPEGDTETADMMSAMTGPGILTPRR